MALPADLWRYRLRHKRSGRWQRQSRRSRLVVEVLLGHIGHQAGVAGVYNQATYLPECRNALDRWADWKEDERLVVNIANIYAELDGTDQPPNPLEAFQQMAELAASP